MKRKLIALLLCVCTVLCTLCACANQTEDGVPQGKLRAKSAALGLWIFYPEAWSVVENDTVLKIASYEETTLSNPDAYVYAQDASVSLANLVVVRLDTGKEGAQDLDEYANEVYPALFSDDYVFDTTPERPAAGTTPRVIYTYHKLDAQGKVQYRFCQCLAEHSGAIYAVTFTATDNLFSQFLSEAKEAMLSLTFEFVPDGENTPIANPASAPVMTGTIPQKAGYAVLTNDGVPYYLYYPENEFTPVAESGFLALEASDHASVSVSTFDRGSTEFTNLSTYLDERYFVEFDKLYGSHTELSRRTEELADRSLCEVEFTSVISGEAYRFRLSLLYHASILEGPISLVTGDLICLVLYTARDADYETHLASVDAIVRELDFK